MTEPADTPPPLTPNEPPDDHLYLTPVPMASPDTAARSRRQPAKRPPRLDWRPAHCVQLRAPGGGDDDFQPVAAVAFHDGWITARIEDERGDRLMAYPAWRVIEIEMREGT